jgi:hypothetical protein
MDGGGGGPLEQRDLVEMPGTFYRILMRRYQGRERSGTSQPKIRIISHDGFARQEKLNIEHVNSGEVPKVA